MQTKVQILNSTEIWNAKKRYKINETCSYNGIIYQNTTGINSDPLINIDWITTDPKSQMLNGTQYTFVSGNGSPIQNSIQLQNAYNLAKTISGLSSTNRFKIIIGTGKYQFSGQFSIDTEFIDIVSLTGSPDVEFVNGIIVSANDVLIKGLKTSVVFEIAADLNQLICENCIGGDSSFGGGKKTPGTFKYCIGGEYSFGAGDSASGIFKNCIGGNASFGGGGTLDGKLYNCELTGGTFETVSLGGRTYYCIDGNGDPNNQ